MTELAWHFGWTPEVLDALTGPDLLRWADNLKRKLKRRPTHSP